MNKDNAAAVAAKFAERIQTMPSSNMTGFAGTSNRDTVRQELQIAAARLQHGVQNDAPKDNLLAYLKVVESKLYTANMLNIINESDLNKYFQILDELHSIVDKK